MNNEMDAEILRESNRALAATLASRGAEVTAMRADRDAVLEKLSSEKERADALTAEVERLRVKLSNAVNGAVRALARCASLANTCDGLQTQRDAIKVEVERLRALSRRVAVQAIDAVIQQSTELIDTEVADELLQLATGNGGGRGMSENNKDGQDEARKYWASDDGKKVAEAYTRGTCNHRDEIADLTAEIERLTTEHGLLFDALSLHMRSTGITNAAMEKVEEYRAVREHSEKAVKTECQRLESGWNEAAAERDAALAQLAEEKEKVAAWANESEHWHGEARRAVDALAAEKARADVFRAVLISAAYDDVDDLPARGLEFAWRLGTTVAERTKAEKARADEEEAGLRRVVGFERARADDLIARVTERDRIIDAERAAREEAEATGRGYLKDMTDLQVTATRDHAVAEAAREWFVARYTDKATSAFQALLAALKANK